MKSKALVALTMAACSLGVMTSAEAWSWKKPTGARTEQATDNAMQRRAARRQAAVPGAQRIDDRMQRRDTVRGQEGTERRVDRRDVVRKAADTDQSGIVSKDEAKAYGQRVGETYKDNRQERGAQYIENRGQRDAVIAGPDTNQDGVISPEEASAYQQLTKQTRQENSGERQATYQENAGERQELVQPAAPASSTSASQQ